jgi:hypothetical protein
MHRFPKTLLWTFLGTWCLICRVSGNETSHLNQSGSATSPSLEIRVSSLLWESGCLRVGLQVINQSNVPVFLTAMGPYFDVALDVSKDNPSSQDALEWVNVRGVSDIVTWDAEPMAEHSSSRKNYCIGKRVWVVNRQKKTRREIPVRGQMRITVSYFPNEDAYKKNKSWHYDTESAGRPHNPFNPPEDTAPQWTTVTIDIPCPNATCGEDCARPPLGFHGEVRVVPDVYFIDANWNRRGEAVTHELDAKYPPCAEVR